MRLFQKFGMFPNFTQVRNFSELLEVVCEAATKLAKSKPWFLGVTPGKLDQDGNAGSTTCLINYYEDFRTTLESI